MTTEKLLKDLFRRWKQKHSDESEESCVLTKKTQVDKLSFCSDGLINVNCIKPKVLFVLIESNLKVGKEDSFFSCKDEFWIRDLLLTGKYRRKCIPRRLEKAQKQCFQSDIDQMAYININKRGGLDHYDIRKIQEYANCYKELIEEEIRILNPDIIVCCGETANIIKKLRVPGTCSLYSATHPSYKGKLNCFTDAMFLQSIEKM